MIRRSWKVPRTLELSVEDMWQGSVALAALAGFGDRYCGGVGGGRGRWPQGQCGFPHGSLHKSPLLRLRSFQAERGGTTPMHLEAFLTDSAVWVC
ncbi:hypothetical protein SKAU_G00199140 [Synaphobranchus kaupii]|uniref:Uncharacterized protein n=1 Tax=Synaphobranchus kaupii TaxID=118154 RepID=A0A9Q1FF50_SYNKA|nr:hypothetical protein SKAU_G00199140 [Synaphobranchus kaupii]